MGKTILVIGSVTSKQYAPLRRQITLLGDHATIVRSNEVHRVRYATEEVVAIADRLLSEQHDKVPTESTSTSVFIKAREQLFSRHFESCLGSNASIDAVVFQERELLDLIVHAHPYFQFLLERFEGRKIWVSTPTGLVAYDGWSSRHGLARSTGLRGY